MDRAIQGPGDTILWAKPSAPGSAETAARFVSGGHRERDRYLIPNDEEFVTSRWSTGSFSDDFIRLDVRFRVSYDSDPLRG